MTNILESADKNVCKHGRLRGDSGWNYLISNLLHKSYVNDLNTKNWCSFALIKISYF